MFFSILAIFLIQITNSQQRDLVCPDAIWTLYNNATCHTVIVTPANAFQAQEVCSSLGANLADPADNNELTAIKNGVLHSAWNKYGAQDTWVFLIFIFYVF